MKSDTRAAIDAGQAYVSTMDADTLMAWFMNESGYHPISYLKAAYPGLHDLDLDLAVEKAIPRPGGR